jgi:hypothetical protein
MLTRDQEEIHEGDPDIVFRLRVKHHGRPVNLAPAEQLLMIFEKPDGSTFTRTAYRTGTNVPEGMQYVTEEGELRPYGMWGVQGFVRMPGEGQRGKRTNIVRFRVYPNVKLIDYVDPEPLEVSILTLPESIRGEAVAPASILLELMGLPPTLEEG